MTTSADAGKPPAVNQHSKATHAIVAAMRQRGNPILAFVRSTLVEFVDGLAPDYLAGPDIAVCFISLKFQRLHPEYLARRIDAMGNSHKTRVLLCRVDLEHPEEQLQAVTLKAFHSEISLVLAWSDAEAAAYLETLHRHQNQSADALMAKVPQGDLRARLTEALTTVRGVNKTDAANIMARFVSMADIAAAPVEGLQRCPGIGGKKVRQLHNVFHTPFFPTT